MPLLLAFLKVVREYLQQSRNGGSGSAEVNRHKPRSQDIYKVMQLICVRYTIQSRVSCDAYQ
jgi:hypothetical protein